MTLNPADRVKAAVLAVAIVLLLAFVIFTVAKRPSSGNPAPPEVANNAATGLPSTESIANPASTSAKSLPPVDLNSIFASNAPENAESPNPFRSPVPRSKDSTTSTQSAPTQSIQVPTQNQPDRQIDFGSGASYRPLDPGGDAGAPTVDNSLGIQLKGIITPMSSDQLPQAFVKVGDKTKGFRVGQQVAPGVSVVAIEANTVTFKIGSENVRVGVGQDVRPSPAKLSA